MILIDWPTRSRCIANPRAGMVVILLSTFKKASSIVNCLKRS
jgi:hypothetical protein